MVLRYNISTNYAYVRMVEIQYISRTANFYELHSIYSNSIISVKHLAINNAILIVASTKNNFKMHSPKTFLLAALPFLTAVTADCGSIHPVFTLDPINLSSYYTYTTPAASGPKEGQISFSLKNDQVDYTTQCKGVTVQPLGQFYRFQTFDCTSGKPWEKSSFSYDSNSKVINLNSTWTCGG